LPAASVTPPLIVTVYRVPPARLTDGLNVAVLLLTLNVPDTGAPSAVLARLKLVLFSVKLFIGSEKVAETDELNATPVVAFAGEVEDTVGGVVSDAAPVVKFQVKLSASGLPAMSSAAVVRVAVYCVFPARLFNGTNVAVLLFIVTTPLIAVPPEAGLSVKLALFSVDVVIASENIADTAVFNPTAVSAFVGDVSDTVGGVVSGGVVSGTGWTDTEGVAIRGVSPPPPPHPGRLRHAKSKIQDSPPRILAVTVLAGGIGIVP
jgi:hypothetical protein